MSLLPYSLRPRYLVRSFVIRRGVVHPNPLIRPIAMLMVGQGDFLRARALRQGAVMGNPFWRAVGAALLLREVSKQVFDKPPERLARQRVRPGRFVTVSVSEPRLDLSRRERRAELNRLQTEGMRSVRASKRRS
jgi:hypothetical protein